MVEEHQLLVGQVLGAGGDAEVGDRFDAFVYEKREVDFLSPM
jgi:hypothetical protein